MCVHPGIMSGHAEEVNMETKKDLFKAAWKMKTFKWEERQVSETTMDSHSGQVNSQVEQNVNKVCLQNGDCINPPDGEISILGYKSITCTSGVTDLVDSNCAEEEIYRCDVYGLGYNDNAGFINDHTYFYTGQTSITCKFCDAKFFNVWYLKDHIIHLDKKTFKCKKIHRRSKSYRCAICDTSFSSFHRFNIHKRIHMGEKPYTCDDCGRRFAVPYQLKVHIQIHTGEKPYQCEDCGAVFSQKTGLKYHKRIHTGQELYRCDICSKALVSLYCLKMHKRIHTGEKPYKCDVCSKQFVNPYNLIRHTRIHRGEKPYICDECGTSFTQKDHMKTHKRIHTGETPYKCDACGAAFSRKSSLTCHTRTHTGKSRVKKLK